MISITTLILASVILFLIFALFFIYQKGVKVTTRYNKLRTTYSNILDELDSNSQEISAQQQSIDSIHELIISNEDRFRVMTEQSLIGVMILENDKISFVNKAAADLVGYPLEEVKKWQVSDFFKVIHPDYVDFVLSQASKKQQGNEDVIPHYEWKIINKAGETRWVESFSKTITSGKGFGDLITVIDIEDRKRIEQNLVDSEIRFRKLFDNSNDAIFIYNENGVINDANIMAQELLGYSYDELYHKNVGDFIAHDSVAKSREAFRTILKEGSNRFETVLISKKQEEIHVNVSSRIFDSGEGLIQAIVRDITEYVKTLEHIIHSERMGIIGNLASGMAHEINNPIGIILQGIELIEFRIGNENKKNKEIAHDLKLDLDIMNQYLKKRKVFDYINGIKVAGNRAAQIISNVMQFAMKKNVSNERSPLSIAVDKAISMAFHDYDFRKKYNLADIKIINSLNHDLPPSRCSDVDLAQILLNLIKNSLQSFKDKLNEGVENYIEIKGEFTEKGVGISIIDNGSGIDSNDMSYVFDPFFTTHPLNDSVGLGLYIVYFLVTSKYEGKIDIESHKGVGTKVYIRFPVE